MGKFFLIIILIILVGGLFWYKKITNFDNIKEDILFWINDAKKRWEDFYKDWKKLTASAAILLENAPEKIEKFKWNIENVVKDAKEAKIKTEEKIKQAKETMEKIKEAQSAFSKAMDAFSELTGSDEKTWTWEKINEK